MRVRQLLTTIAIGGAIAGLVACGGGSKGRSTTNRPTQQQRLVAAMTSFAQCARRYGVPVPDPDPNGVIPNIESLANKYTDTPQGQRVLNRCASQLRTARQLNDRAHQVDRAGALRFARCMRAHGIPLDDPSPNGDVSGPPTKISKSSPQVRAAAQICMPQRGTSVHQTSVQR
jgi:hypothetical protein